MTSPGLALLIGGQWLRSRGAWGDLQYSFTWPGGCKDMSFSMTTRFASRVSGVIRGADAQVCWGGWPLWRGITLEPDWNGNTVTVTANGLFRQGETYPAFDSASTMNAITNPTTALTTAIGLGLPWTIDTATVPNTDLATGATTDPANTITELLNAWTTQSGNKWYVNQFGLLKFAADPATPSWIVVPGSGDLGIADDDYASNVVLRYNDSTAGVYKSVAYPVLTGAMDAYGLKYGRKVSLQDITDQGPMSAATAATLAQNTYTLTKQRPGWTNGLSLARGELMTPGRTPVHAASVDAFCRLVRLQGVPDEVNVTPYTDFVVGDTSYADGSDIVSIDPVGLAARTPEDVAAEQISALISAGLIAS